jgi:hypothetical protein
MGLFNGSGLCHVASMVRRILMAFPTAPVKKGLKALQGLEAFVEQFLDRKLKDARIEEKVAALRRALNLGRRGPRQPAAAPPAEVAPPARRSARGPKVSPPRAPSKRKRTAPRASSDPAGRLQAALDAHPRKAAVLAAGQAKDQLLRSLIPLYLAQGLDIDVTSGTTTRFWARQGVKFAAPNAAKALRQHEGFSRRTSSGPLITPDGVKYVEDALAAR